jgi:hypothetical protein
MKANHNEIAGLGAFEQEQTETTEREVSVPSVSFLFKPGMDALDVVEYSSCGINILSEHVS